MSEEKNNAADNLPVTIGEQIASVPASLVPRSIKALDRLIGAAVDVPVAWLGQQKAKIDAQTAAFQAVETAVGKAVASEAAGDPDIVARAAETLVRKAYRKQENLTAAAKEAIDHLKEPQSTTEQVDQDEQLNDDWLNVFERFAEDASTSRMQKLWGRVLAGEIRRPGKYSIRTLRFLSEFSQREAELFEGLSFNFFASIGPKKLLKPDEHKDIRDLLYLEESGIIQGASGLGLSHTLTIQDNGFGLIVEGPIAIGFKGEPGTSIQTGAITLSQLGTELLSLLPGRDFRQAARNVGFAMRTEATTGGFLFPVIDGIVPPTPIEVLWGSM